MYWPSPFFDLPLCLTSPFNLPGAAVSLSRARVEVPRLGPLPLSCLSEGSTGDGQYIPSS